MSAETPAKTPAKASARKAPASPFPTAAKPRLRLPPARPKKAARPKRSTTSAKVGAQVKAMRLAQGMPASALASAAGISRSMLSRIEGGLVSPSIEVLDHIAAALNVGLPRFFGDEEERHDFSFVPAGQGLQVDRVGAVAGYRYELLGHVLSGHATVEPYHVALDETAAPYVTFQHGGLKFLHMTAGRVVYRYGSRSITLQPGDSLLFDAKALHGIAEILQRPVAYLVVVFSLRE